MNEENMTLEELQKKKAEIEKKIKELKYEKKHGRVRLMKDTYKKLHRGWDLAIRYRDVRNGEKYDKWRNVISTPDKYDILPFIEELMEDLEDMRRDLVSEDGTN